MIEIIFGSPDEKIRDKIVLEALDKFYNNYNYIDLLVRREKLGELKMKGGVESKVSFYAENNYTKLMAKNRKIEK
jgi:hypothetical protein